MKYIEEVVQIKLVGKILFYKNHQDLHHTTCVICDTDIRIVSPHLLLYNIMMILTDRRDLIMIILSKDSPLVFNFTIAICLQAMS